MDIKQTFKVDSLMEEFIGSLYVLLLVLLTAFFFFPLNQGLANYGRWATSHSLPVLVNKVLMKVGMPVHLQNIHACP